MPFRVVVAPLLITKLLNAVNIVVGKVLLAVNCTVPVPDVNVFVPDPESANELQVKVPPDVIVSVPP